MGCSCGGAAGGGYVGGAGKCVACTWDVCETQTGLGGGPQAHGMSGEGVPLACRGWCEAEAMQYQCIDVSPSASAASKAVLAAFASQLQSERYAVSPQSDTQAQADAGSEYDHARLTTAQRLTETVCFCAGSVIPRYDPLSNPTNQAVQPHYSLKALPWIWRRPRTPAWDVFYGGDASATAVGMACGCGPNGDSPCTAAACKAVALAHSALTFGNDWNNQGSDYLGSTFVGDCQDGASTEYSCGCTYTTVPEGTLHLRGGGFFVYWGGGSDPSAYGQLTVTGDYAGSSDAIACSDATASDAAQYPAGYAVVTSDSEPCDHVTDLAECKA